MKVRRPTPGSPEEEGNFREYLSLSALGIEMGVAVAIGLLMGWFLDRLFGTRPWLTFIFFFFGILAGFANLVRLARKDWDGDDSDGR